MAERLCCPVDAYMLLERDGRLLMLRRAPGASYAAGLLCPPQRSFGKSAVGIASVGPSAGCVMTGGRQLASVI
jgi:hypothetical protein